MEVAGAAELAALLPRQASRRTRNQELRLAVGAPIIDPRQGTFARQAIDTVSVICPQSKAEALRLSGSGLLVADASVHEARDPESYYLVSAPPLVALKTVEEIAEQSHEVLAKVLFVCRPPDMDSEF